MVTELLEQPNLSHLLRAVANLIKLPTKKMWLDYDAEVDVLYLHFTDQPTSTHSQVTEEGIILDFNEEEVVGMTILEASHR
ncbi:MAG: DUF2283 domain-containing protein [Chloroflexi bacterium]|nr:DUF2283 domain-containing protein [Chloroflexota bacterium]MBP8055483.1 DUF2283 domain-containing protein [Chloroflexota bacterium]